MSQFRPEFSKLAREGNNDPWRYVVSILLILFLWFGMGGLPSLLPVILAESDGDSDTFVDGQTLEIVGYPILDFTSIMLGFVFLWAGLFVAARFVHCRPFLTMVTAYQRVDWRRMYQGFGLYLPLVAAAFLVGYLLEPQDFRLVLDPLALAAFVPAVLALVIVQAGAEEVLSRGYLLQLFGLATSNLLILSLINGVIFALPHLGNPELPAVGEEGFWLVCVDFVVFGFLMTVVTLKDEGIELAVGAHVATNFFALVTVNYEGLAQTPTVFRWLDPTFGYTSLAATIVVSVAFYLLAFSVFRRKQTPPPFHD